MSSVAAVGGLFAAAIPLAIVGWVAYDFTDVVITTRVDCRYMESLAIGQAVARQYGHYTIDSNQELLALGLSNAAVAFAQVCAKLHGYVTVSGW